MVEKGSRATASIVYPVQGTTIIILNVLSVIVFWRKRSTLKRASYLLVNLAVADALVGVVQVTSVLLGFLISAAVLVAFSVSASLSSLAVISIERLMAIWKPLRHRARPTKYYFLAIGLIWTFATTNAILYVLYIKGKIAPLYILPLACKAAILCAILFSYTAIWYVVVFHPRPVQHNREQNRKLTKTLFIVTAVSLLTWTPSLVIFAVTEPVSWRVELTINILMFGNSLVNPIMYIFRMQEFREELKRMFCRYCLSN